MLFGTTRTTKTLRVFSILVLTNDAVCFLFFAVRSSKQQQQQLALVLVVERSSGKNPKHMCFLHLQGLWLTLSLGATKKRPIPTKKSFKYKLVLLLQPNTYRYWRRREITSQIPIKMKVAFVLGALPRM